MSGLAGEGLEFACFCPTALRDHCVFPTVHNLSLKHAADVKTHHWDKLIMLSSPQPPSKPGYYSIAIFYNCKQQSTMEFYNHFESTCLQETSGVTQFRLMSNRGSGWLAEPDCRRARKAHGMHEQKEEGWGNIKTSLADQSNDGLALLSPPRLLCTTMPVTEVLVTSFHEVIPMKRHRTCTYVPTRMYINTYRFVHRTRSAWSCRLQSYL